MDRTIALLLLVGALALGCASVRIDKIPSPDDYELAADCTGSAQRPCRNEIQERADALKGPRFYLPRPYVLVKREFPVGGGTYFASGTLGGNGQVVRIDKVPAAVAHLFPNAMLPTAGTKELPGKEPVRSPVDLQAGEEEGKGETEEKEEKEEQEEEPATETGESRMISEAKASVSGDPTTNPLTRVGPLYDILLLPDFSDQYAINVSSGLFQASAQIGLENGWMAEKLDVSIDNSELGSFLVNLAEKATDAALTAAFPVKQAVDAAQELPDTDAVELQAAEDNASVILRIDTVQLAVPGVYPILKPREQSCGGAAQVCSPKVVFRTREETVISLALEKPPERADGGQEPPGVDCDPLDPSCSDSSND